MTSLRKLDVSSAHEQENRQCYSQADDTFCSQLSVNLQKVTKEEIGLAVALVPPRTPYTFVSISCLWPGFLIGPDVGSRGLVGCEVELGEVCGYLYLSY